MGNPLRTKPRKGKNKTGTRKQAKRNRHAIGACRRLGNTSFQKADRILARADFVRLAKSGKKVEDRYFIFIYSPGLTERSRIGITVSRKVGKASRRNRIKRLARVYFRHTRHRLKLARDINVIARTEAAALTTDQVFSSFEILFKKLVHDSAA